MLKFAKDFFICSLLISCISSCVSRIENSGYMFQFSDYENIKEGISTQSEVLKIMGSPSLIANFNNEESWIYLSQDEKYFLFFRPKIISRTILSLEFDSENVVKNLSKYDLLDDGNVNFSKKETYVKSNKIGFFESIFSNIGQVRAQ